MTTTQETKAPAPTSQPAPSQPPQRPTKTRRRPWLIVLGVLAVALGGILGFTAIAQAGDTQTVLAVRSDVDRGDTITAADLITAQTSKDPALAPILDSDRASVIGKRATRDITAGSLITTEAISGNDNPSNGQALVGVELAPGQLPSDRVEPGDQVRVLHTPREGDTLADDPNPFSATATVQDLHTVPDSPDTVVNLLVDADQVAGITSLNATRRIALVVDGGQ